MIESRVQQPAMAPPYLAFRGKHASPRGKAEHPPDRRDARIIVDIVLHDPPHPGGIADGKKPAPHKAAFDDQLVEQFLIARCERVRQRDPQQLRG